MLFPSPDTRVPLAVLRDGDPVPPSLRGAAIAIGNFDGLHRGHRALIDAASRAAHAGGRPAALLTFDPHPRAFFAPDRPHFRLTPEPVKLKVANRCGLDAVFLRRFDAALAATSAREFVEVLLARNLGASSLVVGQDFHFGRGREGSPALLRDLAGALGIEVTIAETVASGSEPVSSSRIRALLAEGRVEDANALLGYRWFVAGPVVHGAKLGRTLGFPTANLALDPGCGLAHGIYAVRAAIAPGEILDGVASFGRRPTFDDGPPLLETYLFDWSGDLYGRDIEVEFLSLIRREAKFEDADALVRQMRLDEAEARRILAAAPSEPRSFLG